MLAFPHIHCEKDEGGCPSCVLKMSPQIFAHDLPRAGATCLSSAGKTLTEDTLLTVRGPAWLSCAGQPTRTVPGLRGLRVQGPVCGSFWKASPAEMCSRSRSLPNCCCLSERTGGLRTKSQIRHITELNVTLVRASQLPPHGLLTRTAVSARKS